VWRRREFENYFLDSSWLAQSRYLRKDFDEAKLRERLVSIATARLYLEVVRTLIIDRRETAKETWIDNPTNPALFPSAQAALEYVLGLPDWQQFLSTRREAHSAAALQKDFRSIEFLYSGGTVPLQFGVGEWLHRMPGKEILHQLLNEGFEPQSQQRQPLSGQSGVRVILTELLKQDNAQVPEDFRNLQALIAARTAA